MLAFIDVTMDVALLAVIALLSGGIGLLITRGQVKKQKSTIARLETEMLRSHSEILQLQKEISDRENLQSKTPIFSIKDKENPTDAQPEQAQASRLGKKIAGGSGNTAM